MKTLKLYLFARRLYKSIKNGEGQLIKESPYDFFFIKDSMVYHIDCHPESTFITVYKPKSGGTTFFSWGIPKRDSLDTVTRIRTGLTFKTFHPSEVEKKENEKEALSLLDRLP